MDRVASRTSVCEVERFGAFELDAPPDLLIEVPHGATRRADFDAIHARLSPGLPTDLIDFFCVNTDVGSTEYGRAVASLVTAPRPGRRPLRALLIRCLIPRTFIDTNRVIDADTERSGGQGSAAEARPAGLTGALAEYIRDPRDVEFLAELHRSYHEVVTREYERTCGGGGLALMPHTYAPKNVSIESIDEGIGAALRRAYAPDLYATWTMRPEVDLITESPDGERLAPGALVDRLKSNLAKADFECAENASYRLHPITMGHRYSARYPGSVLCLEVRRDLLAEPFSPFEEMVISEAKVARIAAPIADAIRAEFERRDI